MATRIAAIQAARLYSQLQPPRPLNKTDQHSHQQLRASSKERAAAHIHARRWKLVVLVLWACVSMVYLVFKLRRRDAGVSVPQQATVVIHAETTTTTTHDTTTPAAHNNANNIDGVQQILQERTDGVLESQGLGVDRVGQGVGEAIGGEEGVGEGRAGGRRLLSLDDSSPILPSDGGVDGVDASTGGVGSGGDGGNESDGGVGGVDALGGESGKGDGAERSPGSKSGGDSLERSGSAYDDVVAGGDGSSDGGAGDGEDTERGEEVEEADEGGEPQTDAAGARAEEGGQDRMHTRTHGDACAEGYRMIVASSGGGDQLCRFLEFAIRHGIRPRLLGYGELWEGFLSKVLWVIQELRSYPPDCTVMVVDTDVVIQGTYDEMRLRFAEALEKAPGGVVLGADCGCHPQRGTDAKICRQLAPRTPTEYKYANGGFVMGTAASVLSVYRTAVHKRKGKDKYNDQEELNYMLHNNITRDSLGITLDQHGDLVNIMHSVTTRHDNTTGACPAFQNFKFRSGRWFNTHTQRSPSLIHFNGLVKQVAFLYADRLRRHLRETTDELVYDRTIADLVTTQLEVGERGDWRPFYEVCPGYTDHFND